MLRPVLPAPDERVELDPTATQDVELPRRRGQHARPPCLRERVDVAGDEVDRVHRSELVPREPVVVTARRELRPDRRDRPLACVVDVGERPPLRPLVEGGVHDDTAALELRTRAPPERVVAQHREEPGLVRQKRELHGRDGPRATRLLPLLERVGDLAGSRHVVDAREADPLDVPDHGDAHAKSLTHGSLPPSCADLTRGGAPAFQTMMDAVATIPPFELFYADHAGEVLSLLRRRLGRDRADDAFQETFLRALRAYDRLTHGEHLRAWVLTIATRVAIDTHRRAGEPTEELPELPDTDGRPAYEELAFLTDSLPPKERAAVVLRYGYDLDYEQIAAALDSCPDAARQAASSGVRRLRRRIA